MTLSEFKAWLRGYSESFLDGSPNNTQWKKILDELAKVDNFKPKNPVYRDFYQPHPDINKRWLTMNADDKT